MKPVICFFKLNPIDRNTCMRMFFFLLRAEVILSLFPYSYTKKVIFSSRRQFEPKVSSLKSVDKKLVINKHLRVIQKIIKHLPWKPTCLRIAIAIRDSLFLEGIVVNIKLGMKKDNNVISAHAWIEHDGIEFLKNGLYEELVYV